MPVDKPFVGIKVSKFETFILNPRGKFIQGFEPKRGTRGFLFFSIRISSPTQGCTYLTARTPTLSREPLMPFVSSFVQY